MKIPPPGAEGRIVLAAAAGLVAAGAMAVLSASSFASMRAFGNSHAYFTGHLGRVLAGLVLAAAVYLSGPRVWRKLALPLYLAALVAMIPTIVPGSSLAPAVKGSTRWLVLGGFRFMPSELCRFSFILLSAHLVSRGTVSARGLRGAVALSAAGLVPALMMLAQRDFAGALYMLSILAVMLFLSEARFGHMAALFVIIALLGSVFILTSPYRLERVTGWINPTVGVDSENYQPQQACIALGSGGLLGRGLGHGRQQRGFLPEAFSDFILAVIGEEAGFVGTSLVLLAFCVLLWTSWKISERSDDIFGFLLAGGLTASIAIGALLHIAVSTRLLPTTGMTLPLISWGGTSVVFTMASIGAAARISCGVRR